jgi:hypothetical protein
VRCDEARQSADKLGHKPAAGKFPCYKNGMPVNSLHPDYLAMLPAWSRARDVIAGEDAVKAAGDKYLPRLEAQSDQEFADYRARASFFNATARTADGYIGQIFRRTPFIKLPDNGSALGRALKEFNHDADMLGTTLSGYAKNILMEVIAVGRAGSLVDWESGASGTGPGENRVYVSTYAAENIINWRVERINGRNIPTLIVLHEADNGVLDGGDDFEMTASEQIRVLRLVRESQGATESRPTLKCVVELWRPEVVSDGQRSTTRRRNEKPKWKLMESRTPLRLGKPLPLLPFVFHGPRHSRPEVDKLPLADVIAVNLDHYRLNADFKHGVHFTALPTAWVSGFDKASTLRIGSSTAWVTETVGAAAGFLEFMGHGLNTFEKAMDRDERLMAVLGSRLLESNKKVGETAEAIELRQSGEHSILSNIATSVSESLSQVLRWAYWWNSTEESPEAVNDEAVSLELNTDFSDKGLTSQDLQAIVAAWQAGAISRDSMLDLFRRGEVLPESRTTEEEAALIGNGPPMERLADASATARLTPT